MKTRQYILHGVTILLLLLWIPVALDKVLNFVSFRSGILRQPFSDNLGYVLIYSLPLLELATITTLVVTKHRKIGFILSTLLMASFTGYIGIALLGAWEKLPCGCGSVISGMSWKQHFWFNLFFLIVSAIGWALHIRTGGKVGVAARQSTGGIFLSKET